ncbi:MAG: exosome complex exonuclease Rrp41 [Candidatus Micrarchaeia archaeon]|jgi:exosome complex component RRP41
MGSALNKPKLFIDGKRLSGRGKMDLRNLKITAGVLRQANGSALIEWGNNRILVGVYGPREVFPKHLTDPYKAIINARYVMAPFSSLEEHGRSGPNRRSIEISKVAKHVFENNVLVERFPKTAIDIDMEVLQSDGGTRVAAITAASVALVDAGIPVKDLVQGVSVGKIDGEQVVDLDKLEDNYGESDMPAIVSLRTGEVLLYQMDGKLTREEVSNALDMIFEAAKAVREKQVAALVEKYSRAEVEEGE